MVTFEQALQSALQDYALLVEPNPYEIKETIGQYFNLGAIGKVFHSERLPIGDYAELRNKNQDLGSCKIVVHFPFKRSQILIRFDPGLFIPLNQFEYSRSGMIENISEHGIIQINDTSKTFIPSKKLTKIKVYEHQSRTSMVEIQSGDIGTGNLTAFFNHMHFSNYANNLTR